MREAKLERNTNETQISLEINLDGTGKAEIQTGIGFFDHMLTLLAFHSEMDIKMICHGDLEVDSHHSVEDMGIALGKTILEALGDKKGITRYGHFTIPMDEALVTCNLDISGRSFLIFNVDIPKEDLISKSYTEEEMKEDTKPESDKLVPSENSLHLADGTDPNMIAMYYKQYPTNEIICYKFAVENDVIVDYILEV